MSTKIAIVGAGIGGLSAALSLRRLPNVDIQIFERADALREVGASIALGPNGLRGLEEIGASNALSDEIGFRSDHGFPMVYRHWMTGEVLVRDMHSPEVRDRRYFTTRFYRPHLLEALAENVPSDTIHLGKRVIDAVVKSHGATLYFYDGTQYEADLVVAADGINSIIRSTYLPNFKLHFTGQIWLRTAFDASLLGDILDDPKVKNSVHVVGEERSFFSSMLGRGKFTLVGSSYVDLENSPFKDKHWDEEVDISIFRDSYKSWHPKVYALASRAPSMRVFPGWASDTVPTPTYAGRIVLLGDSFHPHGGAFAVGGSLAIDDGIALYLALRHVQSDPSQSFTAAQLARALELYAATRVPHAARVAQLVETSRARASKPSQFWDEKRIRDWAAAKKEVVWLHEHNVHRAFERVLRKLEPT